MLKALSAPANVDHNSIEEHVKDSDRHCLPNSISARAFEYNLNEKQAKSKLVKGAKRIPFEIEANSTSSNFVFSVGAWKNVVISAISYWKEVGSNLSCQVGDYTIKVGGVKAGVDKSGKNVDTQIVFYGDRNKIVCHQYHTTQLILINGQGYQKFLNIFLEPFFKSKIQNCLEDIKIYNQNRKKMNQLQLRT